MDIDALIKVAEQIGVVFGEVILGIFFCVKYINKILSKKDVSSGVRSQSKIDLGIMETLDYYKELLSADRIMIYEFHNGQHYSNYRSALRMSASYECFRAGNVSIKDKATNVLISLFPNTIVSLFETGKFFCNDIEEIKEISYPIYHYLSYLGAKACYDIAFRDKDGNIIGFVSVHWNKKVENIDEKEIERLGWHVEEFVKQLTENDKNNGKKKNK